MGVQGLLPVLRPIQHSTTLEAYRGLTLAIDTYAWLHKAVFSCSTDLVMGKPTTAYISYFIKKLDMLSHFDIIPYFVFDGDYLPTKGNTEKERERKRSEYKALALEALNSNDKKSAFGYFQKACDVSPEIAKSLIEVLKQRNIKYVVAPYEADSQMVFLEKQGIVDGIISEDSDLLIFGCHLLITKLSEKGDCIEIRRENFKKIKGSPIGQLTDSQLKLTAIVSGCDYTKGIPGVGVVKALSLVKRFSNVKRMIMGIKFDGKHQVPETFEEEHNRAILAFDHQIVFNPITGKVQHLNEVPDDSDHPKEYLYSCTGNILDEEVHIGIATGALDPFTKNELRCRDVYGIVNTIQTPQTPMIRSATISLPVTSSAKVNKRAPVGTPLVCNKTATLDKFLTPVSMRSKSYPAMASSSASSSSQKRTLNSIDRFFTKMPVKREEAEKLLASSSRRLSPSHASTVRLSPVAKRIKLINHVSTAEKSNLVASRFFTQNLTLTEKLTQASMNKEDVWKSSGQPGLENLNSSDCVLTDPDNDEEEDQEEEEQRKGQVGKQEEENRGVVANITEYVGEDSIVDDDDVSNKENDSSFLSSDIDEIVTPQVMDTKIVKINSSLSSWKDKFEYKEMTPSKIISEMNFHTTKKVIKTAKRPALRDINGADVISTKEHEDKPKTKSTIYENGIRSSSFTTLTKQLRLDSFKYHT